MRNIREILADKDLWSPERIHLACGHSIPNTGGVVVWDYYDLREVTTKVVDRPDVDTSGLLPGGVTYWFSSVDGSRACCLGCRR